MIADVRGRYTQEDQRFFFPHNNEVVADHEFYLSDRPQVEVLRQVVAVDYVTFDGRMDYGVDGRNDWRQPVPMGAQPVRFFTPKASAHSSATARLDYGMKREDLDQDDYELLDIPDGSNLIWAANYNRVRGYLNGDEERDNFIEKYYSFVQPATDALPRYKDADPEDMTFKVVGIIRPDTTLAVPYSCSHSQKLVDTAVAREAARNALEMQLVQESTGSDTRYSLLRQLSYNPAAQTYLEWYGEHSGKEYIKGKDPENWRKDFPEMTKSQWKRYEKLRNLNSRLLDRNIELKL